MDLYSILNSQTGKSLISKLGHKPVGRIVEITPNSYIEHLGGDTFQAVFFSGNALYKLFDVHEYPQYPLRFLTSPATFNPAAGSVSPVDGIARVVSVNESFALIRAASGSQGFDSLTNIDACSLSATVTSNQYGTLTRGFFLFDTSGLTSASIISAATFSLFVTAKADTLGSASSVSPVLSSPASNSTIISSDFQATVNNTTLQGSAVAISGVSTSAYLDMALNATGISNISLTSISKFGMRIESDRANSAPTWNSGGTGSITVNYADNVTNIPKLVVTFTLLGGGFFAVAR